MRHVKALWLSHDPFSLRHAPEMLHETYAGMGHLAACRGKDYAYVYTPLGLPITVKLDGFEGAQRLRAGWFDPRTGETSVFGILPARDSSTLVPPAQGKGCDWVLVLEVV